jgi:SAM-dependent methyltransferase
MKSITNWKRFWEISDDYKLQKLHSFQSIDSCLTEPPINVLDIGCGFAFESRLLNKKYNSKLWLLEGDVSNNGEKNRDIKFGDVNSMMYYNNFEDIRKVLDEDNIKDYVMLDADNLSIDDDVRFDLVISCFSCGFHYPINSYRDLLLKHSHKDTKFIFDIRTINIQNNTVKFDKGVKITKVIETGLKHTKAMIEISR